MRMPPSWDQHMWKHKVLAEDSMICLTMIDSNMGGSLLHLSDRAAYVPLFPLCEGTVVSRHCTEPQ